jgi:hypothetical protein
MELHVKDPKAVPRGTGAYSPITSNGMVSTKEIDARVRALVERDGRDPANAITVKRVAPWSLKEKPEEPVKVKRRISCAESQEDHRRKVDEVKVEERRRRQREAAARRRAERDPLPGRDTEWRKRVVAQLRYCYSTGAPFHIAWGAALLDLYGHAERTKSPHTMKAYVRKKWLPQREAWRRVYEGGLLEHQPEKD